MPPAFTYINIFRRKVNSNHAGNGFQEVNRWKSGEGILPLFLYAGRACPELVEGMPARLKAGTASPRGRHAVRRINLPAGPTDYF
jgi:hypothetical protein